MAFEPIGQPGPDWRLLGFDQETGKTAWMLFNEDGSLTVKTFMPVDDLLEANAAAMALDDGRWKGEMHRVASVPMHIWQRELAPAVQQNDDAYVNRWLNDIDHRKFRTKGGNV